MNSLEIDLEFKIVVDMVVQLIEKPMNAIINENDFTEVWHSKDRTYKWEYVCKFSQLKSNQ